MNRERDVRNVWALEDCNMSYSLASGDLEDLRWESDGALHAELLVFGPVDEVI